MWLGSRSDKERGTDCIKRAVLKNSYDEGGLNVTDLDCMNRALKLGQFVRAKSSKHPITRIQTYCLEKIGYGNTKGQEYTKISVQEDIISSAMDTINIMCDYRRGIIMDNCEEACGAIRSIDFVASTDVSRYLIQKNKRTATAATTTTRTTTTPNNDQNNNKDA